MAETGHRYFIVYKPFNMVSQFVSTHDVRLLGNLDFDFPPGTHAIGRLDNQSEGLLLLTTNKKVTALLFQGAIPHRRTYLVQVNNQVNTEGLDKLKQGIPIRVKGGGYYTTAPCLPVIVENPYDLFVNDGNRPSYPPFTWLQITLTEGKFHQVRKMFAAIHHRCKRLIRLSIEEVSLGAMKPGEILEMQEQEFFQKLHL